MNGDLSEWEIRERLIGNIKRAAYTWADDTVHVDAVAGLILDVWKHKDRNEQDAIAACVKAAFARVRSSKKESNYG